MRGDGGTEPKQSPFKVAHRLHVQRILGVQMFKRFQVRIRRHDDPRAFAIRLNAARTCQPDARAEAYRRALNLLVIQGQFGSQEAAGPGRAVGHDQR